MQGLLAVLAGLYAAHRTGQAPSPSIKPSKEEPKQCAQDGLPTNYNTLKNRHDELQLRLANKKELSQSTESKIRQWRKDTAAVLTRNLAACHELDMPSWPRVRVSGNMSNGKPIPSLIPDSADRRFRTRDGNMYSANAPAVSNKEQGKSIQSTAEELKMVI